MVQVIIVTFVIIIGSFKVDVSNWTPFAPNGYREVLTGATVVFFAYVGFDAVANSAEESKRPQVSSRIITLIPLLHLFSALGIASKENSLISQLVLNFLIFFWYSM